MPTMEWNTEWITLLSMTPLTIGAATTYSHIALRVTSVGNGGRRWATAGS